MRKEIKNLPIYDTAFFGICRKSNLEKFKHSAFEKLHPASSKEIDSLKKAYPHFKIEKDETLLTGCQSTFAKSYEVIQKLLDKSISSGKVTIHESVKVEDISTNQKQLKVHTDFGMFTTNYLINTTGPWIKQDLPNTQRFRIKKIVCFNIHGFEVSERDPVLYFFEKDAFIFPDKARNRHVLSITSQEWDCKPNPAKLEFNEEDKNIAIQLMTRSFKGNHYQLIGGRKFCDSYAHQNTPEVFQDERTPKIIYANGGSGSGFRLAPAIAANILKVIKNSITHEN
jgi:glycine/D-amino acid oxidase-like deaminating enzyme